MNWFERHLNITAVFIILGFILFSFFMGSFSVGFNYGFPLLPFLPILLIVITICFALVSIGHGWVLKQKNKNLGFLTFYLPVYLLALIIITISVINPFPDLGTGLLLFFIELITLAIIIAGWIILLILKKSPASTSNEAPESPNHVTKFLFFKTTLKYVVFTAVLISLLISSASYLFIGYSSLTYNFPGSTYPYRIPGFSLNYPPNFRVVSQINQYDPHLELDSGYREIHFKLVSDNWPGDDGKLLTQLYSQLTGETLRDFSLHYSIGTTTVDEVPATILTLTVKGSYGNAWGTATGVLFQKNNSYWMLSCVERKTINDQTPAYFTHLLESFKFLEQ